MTAIVCDIRRGEGEGHNLGKLAARQTRFVRRAGQKCQIQWIRGHGAVLYSCNSLKLVPLCIVALSVSLVCAPDIMRLWMLAVVAAVAYAGG